MKWKFKCTSSGMCSAYFLTTRNERRILINSLPCGKYLPVKKINILNFYLFSTLISGNKVKYISVSVTKTFRDGGVIIIYIIFIRIIVLIFVITTKFRSMYPLISNRIHYLIYGTWSFSFRWTCIRIYRLVFFLFRTT